MQAQHARGQLRRASGSAQVADVALHRDNRRLQSAENFLQISRLPLVRGARRQAVRVDVIDLLWSYSCFL